MKPLNTMSKEYKKRGAPVKQVDFKKVDELIKKGCTARQVAAKLGVSEDTLSNRLKEKFNKVFTEYAAPLKEKGNVELLVALYDAALSKDKKAIGALIFLNKVRNGLSETTNNNINIDSETMKRININFAIGGSNEEINNTSEVIKLNEE